MALQVIYNGQLVAANALQLSLTNRAFRYGDGFFESIRMFNGELPFWLNHVQRMQGALDALGLSFDLDPDTIKAQISDLAKANGISNARVRLNMWRDAEGPYKPQNDACTYLIECTELDTDSFLLNEQGLNMGIYSKDKKYLGPLAAYKTMSAQLYVQASRYAKQQGWDDALILNTKDQIIEATSSNLFLVRGSNLHTPPLSSGCIDGTIRKVILQKAMESGWQVSSGPVNRQTLKEADELWLTNAISGIRWVASLDGKVYSSAKAAKFIIQLT